MCWFHFHSSKTLRSSSHHILIKKRVQHSATSDYSDYSDYRYRNPFCLCEFTVSNFKYVKSKSKYAVCFMRTSRDCVFASLNVGEIAVRGPIKTQLLGAPFPPFPKKGRKPLEKTDLQVYEGQWQNDKAHGLGKYTSLGNFVVHRCQVGEVG